MKTTTRRRLGICFWLGCYGLAVVAGMYIEDQIKNHPQSGGWQWSTDPGHRHY
ncbi:MAG TPA: hypothetical protein VGL55_03000 [Steroidobacteraceae bacterium]